MSHLVTAERGLMAGHLSGAQLVRILGAAAVLTAAFALLTIVLYQRRQ